MACRFGSNFEAVENWFFFVYLLLPLSIYFRYYTRFLPLTVVSTTSFLGNWLLINRFGRLTTDLLIILYSNKNILNKTKLCSWPASSVHIFNVRTIIVQSSDIKEWNLFLIQITHKLHNVSTDVIMMSKFNSPKYIIKCAQNIGSTCSVMESLNKKEEKLLELQITQNRHP